MSQKYMVIGSVHDGKIFDQYALIDSFICNSPNQVHDRFMIKYNHRFLCNWQFQIINGGEDVLKTFYYSNVSKSFTDSNPLDQLEMELKL